MNPNTQTLAIALVVLALGPILYRATRRFRAGLKTLDGFILVSVGTLVVVQVLPDAIRQGGVFAGGAFLAGAALPALFKKVASLSARASRATLFVGLMGLAVHSGFDGAAIAQTQQADALAWALVLHRAPVGLLVWWLVRPAFGRVVGAIVLFALGGTTVGGFLIGAMLPIGEGALLASFHGLVAGALLHVLFGHGPELHGHDHHGAHSRTPEIIGGVAGLIVGLLPMFLGVGHEHPLGCGGGPMKKVEARTCAPGESLYCTQGQASECYCFTACRPGCVPTFDVTQLDARCRAE